MPLSNLLNLRLHKMQYVKWQTKGKCAFKKRTQSSSKVVVQVMVVMKKLINMANKTIKTKVITLKILQVLTRVQRLNESVLVVLQA